MARRVKVVQRIIYLCPHCKEEVLLPDAIERKVRAKKPYKRWTKTEIDELVKLRRKNYPWSVIAQHLDRSVSSCANQYHRLAK